MSVTDADRAKAAELTAADMQRAGELIEFVLRGDRYEAHTYGLDAIAAALAAERAAAVADLRARVEALAEELSSPRKFALSYGAIAARLRAAVTGPGTTCEC